MSFNKINTILAMAIFLGVVTSLCAVTTMESYNQNNLGTQVTKFLAEK